MSPSLHSLHLDCSFRRVVDTLVCLFTLFQCLSSPSDNKGPEGGNHVSSVLYILKELMLGTTQVNARKILWSFRIMSASGQKVKQEISEEKETTATEYQFSSQRCWRKRESSCLGRKDMGIFEDSVKAPQFRSQVFLPGPWPWWKLSQLPNTQLLSLCEAPSAAGLLTWASWVPWTSFS